IATARNCRERIRAMMLRRVPFLKANLASRGRGEGAGGAGRGTPGPPLPPGTTQRLSSGVEVDGNRVPTLGRGDRLPDDRIDAVGDPPDRAVEEDEVGNARVEAAEAPRVGTQLGAIRVGGTRSDPCVGSRNGEARKNAGAVDSGVRPGAPVGAEDL